MGKITDIAKQKRNPSRVSVFIDGEFVCGLDAVAAASARIKIGDEITADELKKVVFSSEVNSAFERAVSYLSSVPRSKSEIRQKLRDKGYDRDVIDEAIVRLVSYRYIDDRAYAECYIKSKGKQYGKFRLSAELRKKGVSTEIIDELLDDGDEDGTAAARKYLRSHPSCDVQKLKRFLAGRGFSWDAILRTISDLSEEIDCADNYDD
ncbi:MAG: RecX family transcriptional regulator [Clostridiales bacterium]|nr:RecX family transcriptional regulator [Clostridiales bacterium]